MLGMPAHDDSSQGPCQRHEWIQLNLPWPRTQQQRWKWWCNNLKNTVVLHWGTMIRMMK